MASLTSCSTKMVKCVALVPFNPPNCFSFSCFRSAELEGALQVPPSSVRWCERPTAGAADRNMHLTFYTYLCT